MNAMLLHTLHFIGTGSITTAAVGRSNRLCGVLIGRQAWQDARFFYDSKYNTIVGGVGCLSVF